MSNADCVEHGGGYCEPCITDVCRAERRRTICRYDDCQTDGDCAADEACLCGEHENLDSEQGRNVDRCVVAVCHVDADCPSGSCAYTPPFDEDVCRTAGAEEGFYCHHRGDGCQTGTECPTVPLCILRHFDRAWACAIDMYRHGCEN